MIARPHDLLKDRQDAVSGPVSPAPPTAPAVSPEGAVAQLGAILARGWARLRGLDLHLDVPAGPEAACVANPMESDA